MLAIFKREFKSYFTTPIGYIVLAIFYLVSGRAFSLYYDAGIPQIELVVAVLVYVALVLIPIITMRLMSEDRRQKVDQVLLTSPVKLTSIVLGKFFAAVAMYAMCFIPTVIFEIVVMSYVSVNVFTFLYSLLGILLFGMAFIAIGLFISSLTESTAISAFLTLGISLLQLFINLFISGIEVEWLSKIVEKASLVDQFSNFGSNYFSLPDVVYFLSITAAFLFLCVRTLEKRRWS